MDKNPRVASRLPSNPPARALAFGPILRNLFVCAVLAGVLLFSTPALAQRGRRARTTALEPLPPRQTQPASGHGTFLLALALLGLAWFPAFKNAKRELSP